MISHGRLATNARTQFLRTPYPPLPTTSPHNPLTVSRSSP